MNHLRKIILLITTFILLITAITLVGCKKQDSGEDPSGNVGKKIICKASDFDHVRDQWYGETSLVGSEAEAVHTTDLVVGEKYYFVYTFELIYEGDGVSDSTALEYNPRFMMKTWSGLYEGDEAVTIHNGEVVLDGDVYATFDAESGELNYSKDTTASDVKAYIAIPFTPNKAGMLYVESIVSGYAQYFQALKDVEPRVCANIMESASELEQSPEVTISNLSYGLVGQEAYESGRLDGETDLASISEMSRGRNYVVVDFDVISQSDAVGEVYCGIYMHEGNWEDVTLEQANTAKISEVTLTGGKIFDFSYKTTPNGTKKIRTVLSFTALDICTVDFEFFVYSDNTRVSGTLYDNDSFADGDVSKLKFRVDSASHKSYVTGYETMTGNVVIPGYYQDYPVWGVDEGAFADCTALKLLRLNLTEQIAYRAFENCTSLSSVDFGSKLEAISSRAFAGCLALNSVEIPANVRSIDPGAFAECTGLEEASFENPYTWVVPHRNPVVLAMTHPPRNAQYLTKDYVDWNISFFPAMNVENVRIGLIDEDTYQSGDYDDKIVYSWDGTMRAGQKSYWILDFDYEFLCAAAEDFSWSLYFGTTLHYTISLKEIIGADLEFYEASNDMANDGKGMHAFYLDYGEKMNEPGHIRLIFEVIPKIGNRRITLTFGGGTYINGYDEEVILSEMDVSVRN